MHNPESIQANSLERLLHNGTEESADTSVRELAALAEGLKQLPHPEARPEAKPECLYKIKSAKSENIILWSMRKQLYAWAASILIMLSFAAGGVLASRHSLPGELMYPVKRMYEDVRYILTVSPSGKAQWCVCISERRLNEFVASTKDGDLRPAILSSMLANNRRAIDLSEQMPETERQALLTELTSLCSLQGAALNDLNQCCILPDDTALISAAIAECMSCSNCVCVPTEQ
jgi:hypothetical protein